MNFAWNAHKAALSVLTAVRTYSIEGKTRVMGLIDGYRRTLKLPEIEEKLQALENSYQARKFKFGINL